MTAETTILWRDHYGLHRSGWGDRLVPEAMAHPAKVRPDLAQKIVSHALAEGWWHKGDTLVDPFMGIGGFGLVAGWNGLRVVGVELEAHFVKLVEANIALHAPIWGVGGCVAPVVIHGDSRNLRALVGAAMGSVSSPPYVSCPIAPQGSGADQALNEAYRSGDRERIVAAMAAQRDNKTGYGATPGNLGNLPCGSVSSPPYADDTPGAGGLNTKPPRPGRDDQAGRTAGPSQVGVTGSLSSPPYAGSLQNPGGSRTPNAPEGFRLGGSTPGVAGSVSSPPYGPVDVGAGGEGPGAAGAPNAGKLSGKGSEHGYGTSDGQLGAMPAGSVSSPPYSNALTRGDSVPDTPNSERMAEMGGRMAYGASEGQLGEMPAGCVSSPPFEDSNSDMPQLTGWQNHPGGATGIRNERKDGGYGKSAGQLGNERGDTFWDALRVIATELHALLPPGAVSAWVVKDFVRKGKRVPFCDDCCTLLEQAGFTVFERWRCWMISKATQTDMFTGETKPAREFKGFFRRLAEAKGSPRIDWEEVIWFRTAPPPQEA